MNCQDMEKFIHVYLDREFAEEDRADFERHLADCATCRRLAAFERQFKQQLRTALGPPHLRLDEREALRLRIQASLRTASGRAPGASTARWTLRLVPVAAAALLLVGLLFRPGGQLPIGEHVANDTAATQALEVASQDPRIVRDFYRDKLDFRIDPPRFRDGRTALEGGRLGQVDAHQAAHLLYRRGDQRFSVLLFRPDAKSFQGKVRHRIGDMNVFFAQDRGTPMVTFAHGGVGYAITGDLPQGELQRLVREVVSPLPFPSSGTPIDAVPVTAPGRR